MPRLPPTSTLFPYTTLFRSWRKTAGLKTSGGEQVPNGVTAHCLHADNAGLAAASPRSEEHTSELQSLRHLVCRLLLEKKKRPGTELAPRRSYPFVAVAGLVH